MIIDDFNIEDIAILEAVRSSVGRAHKGSLATKRPDELAGDVMAAQLRLAHALDRAPRFVRPQGFYIRRDKWHRFYFTLARSPVPRRR